MERKLIENSDRGITLNKSLAWTILTVLIGSGFYFGSELRGMSENIKSAATVADGAAIERRAIESRVRSLEQSKARDDERFTSILNFMGKIDGRLERIEQRGSP